MTKSLAALLLLGSILTACTDSSEDADPTRGPARPTEPTGTRTAPAATPTIPPSPVAGTEIEFDVQGIVGAVNEATGAIEINRLQGAPVSIVQTTAATRITSARGGTLRLTDLRPSDRIVARGTIAGDALLASEIEVSAVVPGSAPGG